MRRSWARWIAVVVFGFAGAAAAADAPKPAVVVKPVGVPDAWTGWYAGVHVDHDLTALKLAVPGYGSFDGISMESVYGGLLLGFNHRLSQRVVGGLEIDGSLGRGGTFFRITDGVDSINASIENDWAASVHGRLGYLLSPDTLFYLAGGAVIAHADWGCSATAMVVCPAREGRQMYGWLFAGIGAETRIGNAWRLRYEYQTKFLNTLSFETDGPPLEVTPLSGMARVALIKDLGINRMQPMTYAPFGYAPATWSGFRAGAAGGYSMTATSFSASDGTDSGSFDGFSGHGFTGGVLGGYDYQFGNHVLGVEGVYNWSDKKFEVVADGYGSAYVKHDAYYGVRARFGAIVNPSTLVYGLAGWTHVNWSYAVLDDVGLPYASGSAQRNGVEFGGGIETWVNKHTSVKAEYSYSIFKETESDEMDVDSVGYRSRVGTATLGVVFHLGGPLH